MIRISPERRTRLAGMAGNALEWYDFTVYGYFAAIIGHQFFPSSDPEVSVIAAFGVFAIGFAARPVGSVLFGHIGDRFGRRPVLVLSVLAMGVPTTLIGLLPSYAQIGVWAPAALILLRLLQGLSVGGEMTGSITFMIEGADARHRGLAGSWAYFGLGVGCLLGSGAGAIVNGLLGAAAVADWGWRLPFLCGAVIAACGYFVRRQGLTEEYRPPDSREPWYQGPLREAVTKHLAQMIQAVGITAYYAASFYMIFVYVTTYLTRIVGDPAADAFEINSINMVVFAGMAIVGGMLGDRIGFRRMLLTLAIAGLVLSLPLFWLLDHRDPALAFAGQFLFVLILAPYGVVFATMMALLFPTPVRMSGFSISFNVAFAALGGTAPMVATYLIHREQGDLAPAYVLMVCAAISIAALVWAGATRTERTDAAE
jgi:MFS transporter, MHS family, proline/betaine transporter